MKKGERKAPHIFNDPLLVLTPEEKSTLRAFLASPVYVKLMRYAERFKPSANCGKAGTGERDQFSNDRANARLGEIRGWELHIAAIFSALHDAPKVQTETDASFPSSGMLRTEPTDVKPS
jgi:hypothetical protein